MPWLLIEVVQHPDSRLEALKCTEMYETWSFECFKHTEFLDYKKELAKLKLCSSCQYAIHVM